MRIIVADNKNEALKIRPLGKSLSKEYPEDIGRPTFWHKVSNTGNTQGAPGGAVKFRFLRDRGEERL